MKRRKFLKLLGQVSAIALTPDVISKNLEAMELKSTEGFGLAQIKPEGGTVIYDAEYAKVIWPGIKKYWEKEYNKKG